MVIPIIVVLNFLLQTTLFQHIQIAGIVPNTSLIVIISFGILRGRKIASTMGLIIGLLQDIMFSNIIGVYGLLYFIMGYLFGLLNKKLFKENLFVAFVLTYSSTIILNLILNTLLYFLGYDVSFLLTIKKAFIIEGLYNSLLAIPIYMVISKLYKEHKLSFTRR